MLIRNSIDQYTAHREKARSFRLVLMNCLKGNTNCMDTRLAMVEIGMEFEGHSLHFILFFPIPEKHEKGFNE